MKGDIGFKKARNIRIFNQQPLQAQVACESGQLLVAALLRHFGHGGHLDRFAQKAFLAQFRKRQPRHARGGLRHDIDQPFG